MFIVVPPSHAIYYLTFFYGQLAGFQVTDRLNGDKAVHQLWKRCQNPVNTISCGAAKTALFSYRQLNLIEKFMFML